MSVISMLIALLLFFAGVAHAGVTSLQITTDPANQGRPDVAGDMIVWKDWRAGNWDIFQYDLTHGVESPVVQTPAYQNLPVTNGQVVVWQDDRAGAVNNDVYMKSVSGGAEQLLVSGAGNQGLPAISGNLVAYVDDRAGNNDIYVIDIDSRIVTPVCTNPASQWQPRISGTKVVWEDNRNGNWDIYMYDLATGVEQPEKSVTLDPGDDRVADISDDIVVWQHLSGSQHDIWMKDLTTDATSAITNDAAFQNSPRISGDLVVWENYDYQRANYDINMKDLTSGVVSPLIATAATEARPALEGETVVWESTAAVNYDVWMTKVLDTTAPAILAQAPAAGSQAPCTAPPISASFKDNRVGIDTSSVRLNLDGSDVTAAAQITEAGISYQPEQLLDGEHRVELTVADSVGNSRTAAWDFSTTTPNARLSTTRVWWGSYDDYVSGDLSVQFHLENTSGTPVSNADLLASTATQGVLMTTETPVSFGPIPMYGSTDTIVKYHVPPGIISFKTVIYVALTDSCSEVFYYPGPPPGP